MSVQGVVGIPLQEFAVIYEILLHVRLGNRITAETQISELMAWVDSQPELVDYLAQYPADVALSVTASDEDGIVINLV